MLMLTMTTVLVLLLFFFILVGGFLAFLVLEFLAMEVEDDEIHTLSTYIKRARRRGGIFGSFVLSCIIVIPAAWLFGHLVLEWW